MAGMKTGRVARGVAALVAASALAAGCGGGSGTAERTVGATPEPAAPASTPATTTPAKRTVGATPPGDAAHLRRIGAGLQRLFAVMDAGVEGCATAECADKRVAVLAAAGRRGASEARATVDAVQTPCIRRGSDRYIEVMDGFAALADEPDLSVADARYQDLRGDVEAVASRLQGCVDSLPESTS